MFWVDEIIEDILKAYPDGKKIIIRDEKTLSGRVHVGSLRGVVIHGIIAQALNERGVDAEFIYEFNDVDPMDSLPSYLDEKEFGKYMGMPLRDIPSPDGKAKNFAEYWGEEFLQVIHGIGFHPTIVRAGELYDSGVYDEWIEKVLNHPDEIRAIYKEVSGSEKPDDWFPLQVVCENCGKVGSTKVTGWDGSEVSYRCEKDMVAWAKGCEHEAKVSPYGGRGKLPWKVEWPVKWAGNKVNVEGAGKDHCAAGGSHDIGKRIAKEILHSSVPFNVPYEFFLLDGAKMSSSKGGASAAKEVYDSMPPELLRFLMVRTKPNQPIEFKLSGNTIPRLYDQYDEAAEQYFAEEKSFADLARLFHFSQIDPQEKEDFFRPRFTQVSFLTQMPHLDYLQETETLKGSKLSPADQKCAENRHTFAKIWLEDYASDDFVFEIQNEIPKLAYDLSAGQKEFLKDVADILEKTKDAKDEELHAQIHELRKASPLEARDAFGSIYVSLLGKDSGPQAGWFLSALDKTFLVKRFLDVSSLPEPEKKVYEDIMTPYLVVKADVVEMFPKVKSAWALVEGVSIEKENEKLNGIIDEVISKTDFISLKENSEKLQGYRQMFKTFGVDPTKRKPSAIALVDRLAKEKPFPRINVLVDLYNILVIKHQFTIGAFNADAIKTPFILRFAEHSDVFQGIGTDKAKKLEKGELCYFDAENLCVARDFNHYDSEISKVDLETKNVFLNVDGTELHSDEELKLVMEELQEMVLEYCGGSVVETVYVNGEET